MVDAHTSNSPAIANRPAERAERTTRGRPPDAAPTDDSLNPGNLPSVPALSIPPQQAGRLLQAGQTLSARRHILFPLRFATRRGGDRRTTNTPGPARAGRTRDTCRASSPITGNREQDSQVEHPEVLQLPEVRHGEKYRGVNE